MKKRELGIMLIRFLLSSFIFGLIFISITDLNIETTLYGLFGDIFEFSNAEGKQNAVQNLGLICEGFQNQKNSFYQLRDVCDEEKLAELKSDCNEYYELRKKNEIELNEELEESCAIVLSSEIDMMCEKKDTIIYMNATKLEGICEQHSADKINDREFFQQFMISVTKLPDINVTKYKGLIIPLAFVIAFLLGLLYLLHKDNYGLLLHNVGRMLLNLGIMLVLAFTIFHFYGIISPADTTSILGSITGSDQSRGTVQEAFPILIPLVLARLFNIKYLIVGGSLLLVGITTVIIFRKKKKEESTTNI